ncbi:hypothetical protein RVR_9486 [Actinacidiphila reveromycinica]|uniref:MmyB-like transcription regulator ligand binding domain-containing protein n=2 Tax=Actinacidiphila reveromycinica TaxID=659352 RepID=A0A7U3UZU3_9ACTN|nr:hypothetical protein RVR_9486 [Streptomyces sp. SN-593]
MAESASGLGTDLLPSWRARIRPRELPEAAWLEPLPEELTVALMARLLHVDERHYRRIEKGTAHGVSVTLITAIAQLLRLAPDETEMLYLWCGKPPPQAPPADTGEVPRDLVEVLEREEHGAYWCSAGYRMMAANRRALANWPWMEPGVNIMVSLLRGPGRAQCVDWETRWAPLLLAQLRRELIQAPGDGELWQLVDRLVADDPLVDRIWRATAESQPPAYGTTRPMLMPPWRPYTGGPVEITVTALVPVSRPDLRLVVGVPAPDVAPQLPELPELP